MCVRYSKLVGVIILLLGVLLGSLAVAGRQFSVVSLLTGVTFFVFGLSFLNRTYFRVDGDALSVQALFGPAETTYQFPSLEALQFDGRKVFIIQGHDQQRVRVAKWLADRGDWAAFRTWAQCQPYPDAGSHSCGRR